MRVAFVCIFSNHDVRSRICAPSVSGFRKLLARMGFKGSAVYDFAPWIPEMVKSFENDSKYEFHVLCLHPQMKSRIERYEDKGVYYHFISANIPIGLSVLDKTFNYMERTDYRYFGKRLKKEIELINPDLVCICGAENPSYSVVALESFKCPTIVILQTLLNSTKRKQYNFGSHYRQSLEAKIFKKVKYFMGYEPEAPSLIKENNIEGVSMYFVFPSIQPHIIDGVEKEYDFVFYAGGVSKNKGVEDAIEALAIVKRSHDNVKMDVIGGCGADYRILLNTKIEQLGLTDSIHFSGFFKEQEDVFRQVQKSRCVVVPGITAPLNSTVRESMFMGLPTITYQTSATDIINNEVQCVITAEMENIQDLAKQMLLVMESPKEELVAIAHNGFEYANNHFSSAAVGVNMKIIFDAVLANFCQGLPIPNDIIA